MAETEGPRVTDDWAIRLAQAIPLSPMATGVAVTAVVFGLFVLWDEAFAQLGGDPAYWRFWQDGGARTEPMFAVLIGFLFGSMGRGGGGSVLAPLRPALRCTDAEYSNLVRECNSPRPSARRAAGFVGILIGLAVLTEGNALSLLLSEPRILWLALNLSVAFWILGVAMFWQVRQLRIVMRVQREFVEIDLMDLSSLTPFARESLRGMIMWLVGSSIGALLMAVSGDLGASALVVVATVLAGVAGLFFPLRGLHHRIREAKQRERLLVNEKLKTERARILESEGPDADAASGKLPGLLAYKQFVESVSEWPIDTGTLFRFAIYLGLPIGSWVGGALVERLVDVVLK